MQRHPSSIAALIVTFAATSPAAEIPIRDVILYKNGVAYFERGGQLRPGESARLDFKAEDMNDVLKSLTIEDRGGGKITGVRYDSSDPLSQKLGGFPFVIGQSSSLAALLDQMKGAQVEMRFGAETVSGTVVSARIAEGDEKKLEREQVVLLLDSGELRTLDLAAASSIRFADPKLQGLLKDYLTAVYQSRSKDKRSVYIDSTEAKDRQVVASYMAPAAVWKSSYRLIFGDQGQPTLEGWAIVDNTSGDDWTNVNLAVVSGRPVSFISKLYDAKYVQRQTVELPEDRVAGPVVYEGEVSNSKTPPAFSVAAMAAPAPPARMRAQGAPGGVIGGVEENVRLRDTETSTVDVQTESRDVGELFEYRFSTPVTIKKDQSAMLPFLQQKLDARKLLIYSESYGLHPMSAAELTNSTGKTLDGGPITVFDANSYAGEALIETLKTGDKRLISYAVDLGTRVSTLFESTAAIVREIHLNRGMLTTRAAWQDTKTYTIRNVDAKPKTLIIEHAERPQYKLLSPKPIETTSKAYRFEVKLGPNATEKFPVEEESVYEKSESVSSLTPDILVIYVQNKALSESGRRQLQQVVDQKRKIADLDQQIAHTESSVNDLIRDQDRIRQNIASLNRVSGQQDQVQKYASQLSAQETQLASLRDRLSDLKKQKTALDSALNTIIEKLDF